jgi:3-hydroxyacyl-CoA dehydrogenase
MIETRPTSQDKLIINVSSIAGIDGGRGILAYAISKGGVIGITLPMARDLGKYI